MMYRECAGAAQNRGYYRQFAAFPAMAVKRPAVYSLLITIASLATPVTGACAEGERKPPDEHFLGGMVPDEHWAAVFSTRYRTATERFNDEGERESLTADSDGLVLDSQVVPLLASLGADASLGTVSLSAELRERRHDLTVGYGISDNLTVGFSIPYGSNETKVDFDMLGGNLASNPFFDPSQPISATNPPLVPVDALGTTEPAGTAGVQQFLTNPIYGYQYKSISSTRTTGIGDPLVGFRWRFHADRFSRAILTPVVRIGMSEENDPDDLFDVPIDDGSTDVRLQLEYIRALPLNFDTRLRLRYTWQLPDTVTERARAEGEYLVPRSRTEELDRDLGDKAQAYLEFGYRSGDWRLFSALEAMRKGSDDYSSPSGQDVSGLEAGTTQEEDLFSAGISWSGVQAWRDKKLPLPLVLQAVYRKHLAGRNRPDREEFRLAVTAVF
jgi:hypothetical protein